MDFNKIWREADWPSEARQIIEGLKKFPDNSKIILLLRHSQRNEPEDFDVAANLNLTPEGRKIAKIFGENLPIDKSIRLFHSKADRCRDTAEEIFNGFKQIGGEAVLKGILLPLYRIGISMDFFMEENKKYDILEIFNRWSAGLYSPELWSPLISYSQKATEIMWVEIENAPEKALDIHVTHDLHLLALRFGWFGIPPSKKWINYLGGFALSFIEDKILLYNDNKVTTVEIPYWWKKT
ncbi:MAG: histidine phosphatase family protein [Candidatus Lokiarchaeota archaeon]|nr:histidine phosphatase family protein [Candidatus Lokiarchaeota archaeon]